MYNRDLWPRVTSVSAPFAVLVRTQQRNMPRLRAPFTVVVGLLVNFNQYEQPRADSLGGVYANMDGRYAAMDDYTRERH